MTTEQMLALVAGGERMDVEFKGEERAPLSDRDLLETVVCLGIGIGGTLLVVVEDDGRITVARPRHEPATDPIRVQAFLANNTTPNLTTRCAVLAVAGVPVLAVEVPAARSPTSTNTGLFKRRALGGDGKPSCVGFHFYQMQGREAHRGTLDYSAFVVADATWADLDPLEFERLRQTIGRNPGRADGSLIRLSDGEIIKALGLGFGDGAVDRLTVGALLLVGREEALRRFVPTHEAAFQVLDGTRVRVNDFFRWPLIRLSEEIQARFNARNEEEEIQVGAVRVGIPSYGPAAFREAVHNALVHRDYTRLGTVHVQWHAERLEISNPGGLVEGVRLDNLLVTPPTPRNPALADAFKRIGLVERTGRGIDTIFEGQLRYGRPAPDYSRSTAVNVQVVMPGGRANLALTRMIVENDRIEQPLTVDDLLILNAIERERHTEVGPVAALTQRDEPTARAILEHLVERGLLEARGERHRTYHLSAAVYREIGNPAAYPRIRNFEPIQQEQMVLQYVTAHGRITRGEVAELCRIGSDEAKYLLRRLVRRGLLQVVGDRRKGFHQRPVGNAGPL